MIRRMSRVTLMHDRCRTSSDPKTEAVVAAISQADGPSMAALSGHDTAATGPTGGDKSIN